MLALTQRDRYQTVGEARQALRAATAGFAMPAAAPQNRLVTCPQCGSPVRDGKACARCGSAAKPLLPKPAPSRTATRHPTVSDDRTEVVNRTPPVQEPAPARSTIGLLALVTVVICLCLGLAWRALGPRPAAVSSSALLRPTPPPVMVALAVSPAGAEVAIDGTKVDPKQWGHLKVAPGEHVLQVHCDGYDPVSKTVTASTGASWKVHMVLLPAGLTIDSYPIGARVVVDGKPVGEAPLTLTLSPATHNVQASMDGYQSAGKNVQVTAGATREVALSLQRIAEAVPSTSS